MPCDTPLFPADLVQRLAAALVQADAALAMAHAPERDATGQTVLRPQPVCCLLHRSLLPSLQDFVQQGGRKIDAWTAQHAQALCHFDAAGDDGFFEFEGGDAVDEEAAGEEE